MSLLRFPRRPSEEPQPLACSTFLPNMLDELICDLFGRDLFLPGVHLADHIYELFSGHALHNLALPGFQRALNLGVSFKTSLA